MKTIKLTKNQFALIDDDDYEYIGKFKWHALRARTGFYACRRNSKKDGYDYIYMHRQILGALERNIHIDHINGNGLDNRKENLRKCSTGQNSCNQRKHKGQSRYKGVSPVKSKKWRAVIYHKGQRFHLGYFDSEEEAARAYDQKALELFKEFAKINFCDNSRGIFSI